MRRLWAPRVSGFRMRERIRRGSRASRRTAGEFADVDGGGLAGDVLEGGVLAVAIVAALIVLTVLIPFVVILGELVIAILLALLGIGARLLFRRPWTVEALSETGDRHRWRVVGLRASREHAASVANAIAHGNPLPGGEEPSRRTVDGATGVSP